MELRVIPITRKHHQTLRWKRFTSYRFAAKENLVPVVIAELVQASQAMPTGFIKRDDRFVLVGIMSLEPGKNMHVTDQGKWIGDYVPSYFRGYPFCLAPPPDGGKNHILCLHQGAELSDAPNEGEAFFDEKGQLVSTVNEISSFLQQVEKSQTITDLAVSALAEAGLVAEWPLKIKQGDIQKPVSGLYKIDEARLNSIDNDTFLKLRKTRSLLIAYAQLLSMANIMQFEKLRRLRNQTSPAVSKSNTGMGTLLGDDDILGFENI
jgi:hypothetical protein